MTQEQESYALVKEMPALEIVSKIDDCLQSYFEPFRPTPERNNIVEAISGNLKALSEKLLSMRKRLHDDLVHHEVACISDDEQMKEEAIEWLQMLYADISDSTQIKVAEEIEAEAKRRTE